VPGTCKEKDGNEEYPEAGPAKAFAQMERRCCNKPDEITDTIKVSEKPASTRSTQRVAQ
jgi:hypothetical protein